MTLDRESVLKALHALEQSLDRTHALLATHGEMEYQRDRVLNEAKKGSVTVRYGEVTFGHGICLQIPAQLVVAHLHANSAALERCTASLEPMLREFAERLSTALDRAFDG